MYKNILIAFATILLSTQISYGFDFHEPDMKISLVQTTNEYNKDLNPENFFKSASNGNKKFLKDFKSYTESSKIKNFWKADLIGDTVYFKNNHEMISLQILEVINTTQYVMKMNGKTISIDLQDGFAKNLAVMKSTFKSKTASLWDLIIPKANADDIAIPTEDLDDALSSAFSWTAKFNSFFANETHNAKVKFCSLNDVEKNKSLPYLSDEARFEEIKYFIKVQNKYVKSEVANSQSGKMGIDCVETGCMEAKELEDCLQALATRRKVAIESKRIHGFSCFKKYESGAVYLNSNLLASDGLIDIKESYDTQIAKLDEAESHCKIKLDDSEILACKKLIGKKRADLGMSCPNDAKTSELAMKNSSGSSATGAR